MPDDVARLRAMYLDVMERILCNSIYGDASTFPDGAYGTYDQHRRNQGSDWPAQAHTMVGAIRLRHLRRCAERVLSDGVPGDFIETGVWRGGASILMRAVLAAYGVEDRIVWLADSFRGIPPPNPEKFPADAGVNFHEYPVFAVSLDEVKANFRAYGLLDDRVRFVEGWFADTLASVPARTFAIIRLDGDLYESTMVALDALYPKLAPGGYVVVDDYGSLAMCRAAVHDYRARCGIDVPIEKIDWTGVYWRKP